MIAIATLQGLTPFSSSKMFESERAPKEKHDAFEARCWREKMHQDRDGNWIIPQAAIMKCLQEAASYLAEKIPGKGQATYTKHFLGGIYVPQPVSLGVKASAAQSISLYCDAQGKKKGGSGRVLRTFPIIDDWTITVEFNILDATITKDVFERYLREAGLFIGIGRGRPANGGCNGRFKIKKLVWKEKAAA